MKDWLIFVASIVQAVAWPVAVLFIVFTLRRSLASLLEGSVRRWKAGPSGVEVEYWDERTQEVRRELETELAAKSSLYGNQDAGTTRVLLREEFQELARVSPPSVVLESYLRVEQRLGELLREAGMQGSHVVGKRLAGMAQQTGLITNETREAIDGLTVLRNLAAHGRERDDLDMRRALDYAALADAVLYSMRQPANTIGDQVGAGR